VPLPALPGWPRVKSRLTVEKLGSVSQRGGDELLLAADRVGFGDKKGLDQCRAGARRIRPLLSSSLLGDAQPLARIVRRDEILAFDSWHELRHA